MIMLLADAKLKITCVDICAWSHTEKCVAYLNSAFGDRITFWKGDTLTTLPAIVDNGGAERWDLIHIDGSHDIDVIREEFELVRRRATPGATVVVFDDYSAPGLADQILRREATPLPILDETVDTIYGLYLMSTVFLGAYSQLAVRPAFPRNDAGCIKILSNVRRL